MASTSLSSAIEEYIAARRGVYAKNTVDGDRQSLGYLLTAVGNIQTGNLDTRHGEELMSFLASRKMQASTMRGHHIRVGHFVTWMKARKYVGPFADPMATARRPKIQKKVRQRVPAAEFPGLLDGCRTPRHRIVVALGLYVFVRAGEIRVLRLDDVNLAEDLMLVRQPKTSKMDEMPICGELDDELRRWLTWYHANTPRPLTPSDPLVPGMFPPKFRNEHGKLIQLKHITLNPDKVVAKPAALVKQALRAAGYNTTDQWGKPLYEGVHTLRRSGARALFDHLVDAGYDGALRTVQAMLHHETAAVTERYLGIDLDIRKRDVLLRGKRMFAQADNVVKMEVAR